MRAPTDTEQPIAQMGNNLIKSSLFEGVELAARCAGGRQVKRRRSGTAQP